MKNSNLWNWTLVAIAGLAVVGVIAVRLLQAVLPTATVNLIAVVFFVGCVLVVGGLAVFFTTRRL
jgi:hypothetical protein